MNTTTNNTTYNFNPPLNVSITQNLIEEIQKTIDEIGVKLDFVMLMGEAPSTLNKEAVEQSPLTRKLEAVLHSLKSLSNRITL